MADSDLPETAAPRRHVSAIYVIMIGVGMVVGAGIFKSPATVAANTGAFVWLMASWVVGGVLSLLGALCYAELSVTFPDAGGDYHFQKIAYGRRLAFLFAWARFAVINTGSIALLGYVLGDYANVVIYLGPQGPAIWALLSIVVLTAFNLRGGDASAADYGMTGLEVCGLLIMVAAGLVLVAHGAAPVTLDPSPPPPPPAFGVALVFVLLAFGGWSEVATLSAEVKDPKRDMPIALAVSVLVITILYMGVNWAFWRGLGMAGLSASNAPAADLMRLAFGKHAAIVIALAIAFATITSINATIVVGARTTYAAGRDWRALHGIGGWDAKRGLPVHATLAQSGVSVLLVGVAAFSRDGFSALVDYTAPVYWGFLLLSGLAVIVLRRKLPDAPRPFKVPFYPWTPLLFAASCGYVMWSSLAYVKVGALFGVAVLIAGSAVILFMGRRKKAAT